MMDAEAVINIILDRTTTLAADADRPRRAARSIEDERDELKRRARFAEQCRDVCSRDFKAAEAKIAEWTEYAEKLRILLNAATPKKRGRAQVIDLPSLPRPLETEIPF